MAMIKVCDKCGQKENIQSLSWYEDDVLINVDVCGDCFSVIANFVKQLLGRA